MRLISKDYLLNLDRISIEDIEESPEVLVIPKGATRKQVHGIIFGILPPELDSPYCSCSVDCSRCPHKNTDDCDVNWWNKEWELPND